MSLQETTKSKAGKTVYAHMGIWKEGDEIHLTIPTEDDFHTTVNEKEGSVRCNKNMYNKLRKLLERNGCW